MEKLLHNDLKIPGIYVKINATNGRLMVMGEATKQNKEHIEQLLAPFEGDPEDPDKPDFVDNLVTEKKEFKVVEIEARILEINKTDLDNLGVEWQQYLQIRQEPYGAPSSGTGSVETTLSLIRPWTAVWGMGQWSRDAIHAKLNMLISRGNGKELSRPKLMCLTGEEAKLVVGGEMPYLSGATSGAAGTSINVEYKEYGIVFNVKPTVLSDGNIFMNLKTEVSELDWTNALTLTGNTGASLPAFTTRQAETVLNMQDGDTVFIAGLIKSDVSNTIKKFPALANVPVLGSLFRSKDFQNRQTELVISLTPRVIDVEPKIKIPEIQDVPAGRYRANLENYHDMIPEDLQGYVMGVQRKILNNVACPVRLLNTGWEGIVVLNIKIDHIGQLVTNKVVKSSGYNIFDEDAISMVSGLQFDPFPPHVDIEELEIEVPIVYREKR